jgi:hypothetical protein
VGLITLDVDAIITATVGAEALATEREGRRQWQRVIENAAALRSLRATV